MDDIFGDLNTLRGSMSLILGTLAVPIPPTIEDVQEGGQILFENYVREEFLYQGLSEPPRDLYEQDLADAAILHSNSNAVRFRGAEATAHTPEGYKNSDWIKIGREMREMADQIAASREGRLIRQRAEGVRLDEISEERFMNLMMELFSQGFSKEKIVLLFYFCSNLIIRSAQQNVSSLTRNLFAWSLRYILNKVCAWVHQNGGWEKVLSKMYDVIKKVCLISVLVVSIGCGVVYIRKNW